MFKTIFWKYLNALYVRALILLIPFILIIDA